MKLGNKFKKALVVGIAMSMAVSTVYAMPTNVASINCEVEGLPVFSGLEDVVVEVGQWYDAYTGITATDQHGNDLTEDITVINGQLDRTKVGSYQLVYRVTDASGNTALGKRKIVVADVDGKVTPPAIFSGIEDATIAVNTSFDAMEGVMVTNPSTGEAITNVKVMNYIQSSKLGTYVVEYKAIDETGYTSVEHRFVTVVNEVSEEVTPSKSPVFSGLGSTTIKAGQWYDAYAGVTATDYKGNDLTDSIKLKYGQLDRTTAGSYQHVYEVTDAEGNTALDTKRVIVANEDGTTVPAATFSGVEDVTIPFGTNFDPMKNVVVTDSVTGEKLTSVSVMNYIQSSKPGTYVVEYKARDKAGNVSVEHRFVTIEVVEAYDSSKVYEAGDRVLHGGVVYVATKCETKGETPGQTQAWKVEDPSQVAEYTVGRTYMRTERVRYGGAVFAAQWWTKSRPGTDASWLRLQ